MLALKYMLNFKCTYDFHIVKEKDSILCLEVIVKTVNIYIFGGSNSLFKKIFFIEV